MTKQCNFCGNVYDSNETTCPFCMAQCDDAGTYATNTTKTSATKIKITRNINGNITTETKTFFDEDSNFENKTIDELKNEINRLFDEDSENIHIRRNVNVDVNGKNINGVLVIILVIIAIIVITFPFLIMLNFTTITTNDIQEEYYEDAEIEKSLRLQETVFGTTNQMYRKYNNSSANI